VCAVDGSLLFAFGTTAASTVRVTSFDVGGDGSLTEIETDTIAFAYADFMGVWVARHPTLERLYVAANTEDGFIGFDSAVEVAEVTYGAGGFFSVGTPVEVGPTAGLWGIEATPDGSVLFFPGFSGGCSAYHELDATGDVPDASGLFVDCTVWGNVRGFATRAIDSLFYLKRPGPDEIRVGEFDGGFTDHGAVATTAGAAHLRPAFDDNVLVAGSQNGSVVSYAISNAGITVTETDSVDIGAGAEFQSSVVLPCEAP
jgi:hypothetical protein